MHLGLISQHQAQNTLLAQHVRAITLKYNITIFILSALQSYILLLLFAKMTSRKNQWSEEQQQLLFKFQAEYGNRWSIIATKFPGKDDSSVKNKFYSTLRKGLRKINQYIVEIKKKRDPLRMKGYKTLQEVFITKLIAVVDNNFQQKYEVKQKALVLSSDIQKRVIEIACNSNQYLKQQLTDYSKQEELLKDIQQFNKNCKKRKGKRKFNDLSPNQSENEASEIRDLIRQEPEAKVKTLNLKEKGNDSVTTLEVNENLSRGTFLLPHTKQNIILSVQSNPEAEAEGKLKIYTNSHFNQKRDDNKDAQKKDITNPINNSINFAAKTEQSQIVTEQNNMQNSTSFNLSGSWFFESISPRDISKKMSAGYMTHASPLPSDFSSPFTFGSLMKNNSITSSNMFDSKNNGFDVLSSSKFFQNKQEQKTLSLLDQLPVFIPNSLVRSVDLQQSTELLGLKQSASINLQQGSNGIANFFPMAHKFFLKQASNIAQQYNFAEENAFAHEKNKGILTKPSQNNIYQDQLERTKE